MVKNGQADPGPALESGGKCLDFLIYTGGAGQSDRRRESAARADLYLDRVKPEVGLVKVDHRSDWHKPSLLRTEPTPGTTPVQRYNPALPDPDDGRSFVDSGSDAGCAGSPAGKVETDAPLEPFQGFGIGVKLGVGVSW